MEQTRVFLNAVGGAALREPKMYAVVMHNDDITTKDFVVEVLIRIFQKPADEASAVMMNVHNNGSGLAGVFTFDIALTKKLQAEKMAQERGFPLRLSVEEAAR